MGEPVLGGETFFEMIRYARARHIWVRTVTNATLLHLKDNYRKLVDAGPNEIQVSIDGATKDVYELIRGGAVFEQVAKNCETINRYCEERCVELTKMWTVVQRSNVHQLFDLIDFAATVRFRSMVFGLSLTDWGQDEWRAKNDRVAARDALSEDLADRLLDHGRARGVKVAFWDVAAKYRTSRVETLCPWPFERAYYSSDSRVAPCCVIANPDAASIGEGETSFVAVWTGKDYEAFRQAHLDGRIPEVCRRCYDVV